MTGIHLHGKIVYILKQSLRYVETGTGKSLILIQLTLSVFWNQYHHHYASILSFQINFKNARLFCELSQLSMMSDLQKDIKNHLHAKKFQRKNIYVIL